MKLYHSSPAPALLLLQLSLSVFTKAAAELCFGNCGDTECVFTVKVDLHSGGLGYYSFEECGDEKMPVLGIRKDKTYRFIQEHETNYYHPLGLAYYADGAHDDADELEPGIPPPGSTSTCGDTTSCPAPMYMKDGEYLGLYSNNAIIAPVTEDEEDFGLDFYEPEFFLDPITWNTAGTYEVALKFDVGDFIDDIFYFCHIHQYMTGRIKFVDAEGTPLNSEDTPEIPYDYDIPSEYDQSCGTYGIGDFQLPNPECPEKFVCDKPDGDLGHFAGCIESMNCAMTVGMTTNVNMGSAIALFSHQMIPHHENAVNMAKLLLNSGELECDEIEDEENPDCVMKALIYEIINQQNFQIQTMKGVLEAYGLDGEDDCVVDVSGTPPWSAKKTKSPKLGKKGKKSKRT